MGWASCLQIERLEKIEFNLCHSTFKAQVSVLQFLVALVFGSKPGLAVDLVLSPSF